ncbi:MAG: NAD(P)H-dependent oxidoreductase subunit E [Candidatus Zixiibacteriota bacterium]|nr:MAG: NAD(P)H-dependent oxidoreductase subunit E [candidate division Zixibacteria bacterium]
MNEDDKGTPTGNPISSHGALIATLENIQARFGYLPEESLRDLSASSGRSLVDIYGVATFYKSFSLKPRGRHLVSVCLGTACHVRGGQAVAKQIEKELGTSAGETTADKEFTLETVNCLGACALGPVAVVDGHYFSKMKTSRVKNILEKAREGFDILEIDSDQRLIPLEVSCARCNHSLMDPRHIMDGHPVVRVTVSFGNKHGRLTLSSVYGSDNVDSEHEIPPDTVVQMFCPHCHAELIGGTACNQCEAPMVPMIVRGGGVVQICSRRGCKEHMLDLGGAILG